MLSNNHVTKNQLEKRSFAIGSKIPNMNTSDITVVVPTRNEARNIPFFLASLPETCHLIVVDTSDDNTPEIIRNNRPNRTKILRLQSNIPVARQAGAELATTEWLLFTDADVIFPTNYFSSLQLYDKIDCIYGSKLSTTHYKEYYRYLAYAQQLSDHIGIPAATGSNLIIRRNVLFEVGGFDPHLVCNEDSELVWRIKRAGYRVSFATELAVLATDHRRLERGLFRKTTHSLLRCALLYFNLIPTKWRSGDWGYWSESKNSNRPL